VPIWPPFQNHLNEGHTITNTTTEIDAATTRLAHLTDQHHAAIQAWDGLQTRLAGGDENVTAAQVAQGPAEISRLATLLKGAAIQLREAEDTKPLPAHPTASVHPAIVAKLADLAPQLATLEADRDKAAAAADKAKVASDRAATKLAEIAESINSLDMPQEPALALAVGRALVRHGVVPTNVIACTPTEATQPPARRDLPLLRVIELPRETITLEFWARHDGDETPDANQIMRGLILDGRRPVDLPGQPVKWAGAENLNGRIRHGMTLRVPTRVVASTYQGKAEVERKDTYLSHLKPLEYVVGRELAHMRTYVAVDTTNPATAHTVDADGLHHLTTGMRVAVAASRTATASEMAKVSKVVGRELDKLRGVVDWNMGAITGAKMIGRTPDWAGRMAHTGPRPVGMNIVGEIYAEISSVFRLPEGINHPGTNKTQD